MTVEIDVSLRSINKVMLGRNVMRRLPVHLVVFLALVLLGAAATLSATPPAIAQTAANPPSTGTTMPSDIDPKSGMRLPLPKREDLDEAGQKAYDRGNTPGGTIANATAKDANGNTVAVQTGGAITSTFDPRIVQFGLKVLF